MSPVRVVLVNLGTPERPEAEAVREFLGEFLSDPQVVDYPRWFWQPILRGMVLRSRPAKVARLYESIWYRQPCGTICENGSCSPLECGTRRLAGALQAALGDEAEVDWAFRYGRRSIARALALADEGGARRIVVVPLFPQRTGSTSGSIIDETRRAATAAGLGARVRVVEIPADDTGYVAGLAERCRAALAALETGPEHLLVSFHGIPQRYDRNEGGRYVADCRRTNAALVRDLAWDPARTTLAFQSKFGPEPWLVPATASRIEELARDGVRHLAVVTPGFLTEGLETLEEIAVQGSEQFVEAGGAALTYLPAVEDHEAFVAGLAALVRPHCAEDGGAGAEPGRAVGAPVAREQVR